MGYAGNALSEYTIPTIIAKPKPEEDEKRTDISDLDFFIGKNAGDRRLTHTVSNCVSHGIINDWDS